MSTSKPATLPKQVNFDATPTSLAIPAMKPEFPPLFDEGFWPLTVPEVRQRCVADFGGSLTRPGIMDGLERLIARLVEGDVPGELWLDGSFVTEKIDPSDADVLLRVPGQVYDHDLDKKSLVDWASHEDRYEEYSCDAYKWIEHEVEHPLYLLSVEEFRYWARHYGRARQSGTPKGIVVIGLEGCA